jgi:hypothetical protein
MSDLPRSSPRDHAFVRSSNPNFGAYFGGACDHRVGGTVCGWPERAHLTPSPVVPLATSTLTDEEVAALNAEWERVDPEGVAALRRSAERLQERGHAGGVS